MQVSGKILVLTTFAVGFAMAAGAWVYQYRQSRRSAEFWGPADAALLVSSEKVSLLELDQPDASAQAESSEASMAGRRIMNEFDLSEKKGIVHLRHALTYDGNFAWDQRREQPLAELDDASWAYVLRFSRGDRRLDVLFSLDFTRLGKINGRQGRVELLPCPRLGPVIAEYLREVGATFGATAALSKSR